MSAIAAVVSLEDQPVAEVEVRRMLAMMRRRGPDALGCVHRGCAALGHALLQTLPEDVPGAQPATDRLGRATVVLDGRIDNRAEMAALGGARDDGRSDAALLAEAFAVAGERALGAMLGDFAAIIWDGPRRTLVAARDVLGLRPLLYRERGGRVLVASEIQALVHGDAPAPDEGTVGEVLAGRVSDLPGTVYRGVFRIPPGSVLRVSSGRTTVAPFTSLAVGDVDRRPEAELHEALRGLLADAVRVRARSSTKVAVMLSGGLDSTTVYLAARSGAAPDVMPFTFDGPDGTSEVPIARATVEYLGGAHQVAPPGVSGFDYLECAARHADIPVGPPGANSNTLRQQAAAGDMRVILTGTGGDEGFFTNIWRSADLLGQGRALALAGAWRRLRASSDPPSVPHLLQATVAPFVPRWLRPLARRAVRFDLPGIDRRFVDRVALRERLRTRSETRGRTAGERLRLWNFVGGEAIHANEENDRAAADVGTEDREPYFDRRIVQFALNLPPMLVDLASEPKAFVRAAFGDRLPPRLRRPLPPLDFEHLWADALVAAGGPRLFHPLRSAEAGWVDRAWVRARADCLSMPDAATRLPPEEAATLWRIASVELWLRALAGEASHAGAALEHPTIAHDSPHHVTSHR
jgi:asparagine synthase (glutamine-hydrolysing)